MRNKSDKNKYKKIIYLILGSFLLSMFKILKKESREKEAQESKIKEFENKELKEIEKLKSHKEPFSKFFNHSCKLMKDIFIPHEHNGHKPKILRAKTLLSLALVLFVLKISLVGYLFFSYPQGARLSEVITDKILLLINQDRSADNLKKLTVNPVLSTSAHKKAEDMIANDYFAHHTPDGLKPWDFIDRDQYPYTLVGENLAINFTTADSVHKALMDSESHKKNILNPDYSEIGIAMVNGMLDNQNTNVLVELFAARQTVKMAVAEPETENIAPESLTESEIETTPENIATLAESTEVKESQIKPESQVIEEAEEEPEQIPKAIDATEDNIAAGATEEQAIETPETADKTGMAGVESQSDSKTEEIPLSTASPNPALETRENFQMMQVKSEDGDGIFFTAKVISIFNYFLIAVLGIFSLTLFFNIIIRIKIQHKHIIVQSILFLIFVSGLIYLKFHYLENVLSYISII